MNARVDAIDRSDRKKDIDYLNKRMSAMDLEYSTFRDHHKEISEFFDPRRGRYFIEDRNRGDKRYGKIINNKASTALRRSTAGMMAGTMSKARPWFEFGLLNREVMDQPEVKAWLQLLRDVVIAILNSSNFYQQAPVKVRELLAFGTGCMQHEDDFDNVARFYTHTIGSYRLSQNSLGVVDTVARRFQMTCYQMVHKFGLAACSQAVRNNWARSNYNAWHTVNHIIELNPFRDATMQQVSSEFQRYRSVYWESKTTKDSEHTYLRQRGYKGFPCYAPRWEVTGTEDIYATSCPGMIALGDVKELQSREREHGKQYAKAGTPPLQGPPSVRTTPVSHLPGSVNIVTSANQKIESMYDVDPRTQEHLLFVDALERRIDIALFIDLFLAVTAQPGVQPKNELQLTQINEERLLMLGPALEQVNGEWLAKQVSRTAQQALDAGIMPRSPEVLQGQELDVEFTSALAVAQRAVATGSLERVTYYAGALTEAGWDGVSKIDSDFAIDEYSRLLGAPAQLVRPTATVEAERQRRQQQAQQQQALEQAQAAANAAKMAADAKLEDDSVLSRAASQGGQRA